MGVKDCYTDFHVDFGGTSVWYHVIKVQPHQYRYWSVLSSLVGREGVLPDTTQRRELDKIRRVGLVQQSERSVLWIASAQVLLLPGAAR